MLLVAVDEAFVRHDAGPHHPERPARLRAVEAGLMTAGVLDDLGRRLEPRFAAREEIVAVHQSGYIDRLERLCQSGGGRLDLDTAASAGSWKAALLAAGAGIAAVDALASGHGDAAFLAVRPPGHHAVPAAAMGFCLINNIAVTAAALAARGQRVMIVDWDAHHGNGTQDIFAGDPRVFYVSLHQSPLYPGTGAMTEVGEGDAAFTTINLPLPAGATGDVYLAAFDQVIEPAAAHFRPDWVLVSAGYDAHRADPLTELGLSTGDFAALTHRVRALAPEPGRLVLFLEGGYDLMALRDSVAATAAALAGSTVAIEAPTSGGPGREVVEAVARLHS